MQKIHFTKLVRFWGIVIILGITTSITAADIITSYQNFNYHSNQLRKDYITRRKNIIRQEVNRTVDLILYEKAQSEKLTRDKIQTRVYEATAIARNIYQQNKSQKDGAEIQKMILDALRPVRFEVLFQRGGIFSRRNRSEITKTKNQATRYFSQNRSVLCPRLLPLHSDTLCRLRKDHEYPIQWG